MKWVYIKNTGTVDHYTLLEDNSTVLHLKYNHHTDTARVNYNEEKRAFMIQPDYEHKNRVSLQNEYGYSIGYINNETLSEYEGYVHMEDEQYKYRIEPCTQVKFIVYHGSSIGPLATCEINNDFSVSGSLNNQKFEKSSVNAALLLLLCWYLYLPVKSSKAVFEL